MRLKITRDGTGDMAALRNSKSRELQLRILSGIVIIAGIIGGIYLGGWAWNIVTAVLSLISLNEYYKTYMKNTYACPSLITTISKERIFPPVNEYDLIGKSKCSKEQMKIIDNEIQNRFSTQ